MFWNKKKLPITEEDRIWIDEDLNWLRTELEEDHFLEIQTVRPTKDFFNRDFDGTEKDAEFILERAADLMKIEGVNIRLEYFSDDPIYMDDGNILSTPEDMDGSWESAAGTYEETEEGVVISIETGQLKNPISLIATIAHELSHQILLGEDRIEENDEFLTDLLAITYGFGIFLGNSRFTNSTFFTNGGEGWQTQSQGYLPEQIMAYAMARLSLERNEETDYIEFMDKSLKKYFLQSLEFLKKEFK